ncbi:MAG: DPP IV N-terminal domain-containing protein [Planctomycetota bacterium]
MPALLTPFRAVLAACLLLPGLLAQAFLELPETDAGLPGTGTIRRYDWFRKLWQEKRSGWANDVARDQHAIAFLGDSITQGFGPDLGGHFVGHKVANRGISGDTTRGMLLRLQGDVLALNPRAVVLLMGTNDLEEGDAPEVIAGNIAEIVRRIESHDATVPIVFCKVFPSSARMRRPAAAIRKINELTVAALSKHPQVTVLDTWSLFANAEGDARPEEFPDLLHPNAAGYAKWAGVLKGALDSLLAPDRETLLADAEERLRAIYERREFGAPMPRVQWLPEGATYVVSGSGRGGVREAVVVDAERGTEGELTDAVRRQLDRDTLRAPQDDRALEYRRGNLHVRDLASNESTALTTNADREGVRNERAQWSPDGTQVLFLESDASKLRFRNRLLADDPSYPSLAPVRFARVGEVIPSLRVGVVAASGGETRWLEVPAPERGYYLGQLEWAGNSHEVLVEWLSRFRDERRFLLCDTASGAVTQIFRETDSAWVVASYGTNLGLNWVRNGQAFVVVHERDGWRHAWLHARDGAVIARLTNGDYDIVERATIDEADGWFYFHAAPDDASRKYLFRVRLDGSSQSPERITPVDQSGTHDYDISPDGRFAIHTWSGIDRPPVTEVVRLPGHETVRVLEEHRGLRERIVAAGYRDTEFFRVKVDENTTLDGWMMKPPDFDASRKYPVLVYVYSEPHAQTVLDGWGKVHADYHRLVADLGYLVVSFDGRGTPAPKGAAWRRSVFGSLGPLSTADQAAALESLARARSYVDLTRVGIWGWSGGGSNTLNAMFRRPDLYKVGIAVAAKPQPHLYNAWFQEIYMRDREVNAEGYRRSAPIGFAEGLRGDLLIVHGSGELNTHVQIIEGLVDRLIELGKRFDYFTYPNRDHGLSEGKGTAVHLRLLMIRYLLDHLERGPK